jgi:hypothetical protein
MYRRPFHWLRAATPEIRTWDLDQRYYRYKPRSRHLVWAFETFSFGAKQWKRLDGKLD